MLKLEVGKSYRTADGFKVSIGTFKPNSDYPFCDKRVGLSFKENGTYAYPGHPYNLVSEWEVVPIKYERTK